MIPVLNDLPLFRQTGDTKYRPLDELFGCDFITLHTPLTKEGQDKTFHLADEKFFKSLKTGCVFINTSRGAVHDTSALRNAIRSGKLKATVLDVWENEPNIDCELLRMVDISTPHIAGYSFDGKVAGLIMIYKSACEFFSIKPKHVAADFLPPPAVPKIQIELVGLDEQELIRETVGQVYVMNRDDFNTREIAMVEAENRGRFFDDLRRNYPVRREFQNTTVVLATEDTKNFSHREHRGHRDFNKLAEMLKGIGFKVRI